MKFTLSWLREHLDTEASLDAIATTLSAIGLEVEGVEDRGRALAPFRIARVVEAEQHPNADRLRALKVDAGTGTLLSVVCGAPNARAGMKGVLGLPGTFVPGSDITLKVGEIRGVKSEGMMCSARELGLGDDHAGIIELPDDAPVGESYAAWAGLDDPVIEISVTPNRGDALAVRGVARDLAAAGLGTLREESRYLRAGTVPASFASPLHWEIADRRACPWVLGRAFRKLRNGSSPQWLRDRLTAIGLRPINALVDVTNFFTYDLGRPLHIFDASKVQGGTLTIRLGDGTETLLALNGREYVAHADDAVIADANGVESLAGIMGGEHTGCDENTTDAFIECALFDPVRVALSGRRHSLSSDARQRFERGIDPALQPAAVEAATRMILELCGGEASDVVSAGGEPDWRREATLRFDRLATFGGAGMPAYDAAAILGRLGFSQVQQDEASITVAVPSWRNDIAQGNVSPEAQPGHLDQAPDLAPERARKAAEGSAAIEAECDLIEEVLRIRGLDQVPAVSLPVSSPVPRPALTPKQARTALARRVLAARGMLDCVSFAFTESRVAALFGDPPAELHLENPIAADLDQMRPTPLAALLPAASRNVARGFLDLALSEIGGAYGDITPAGQLAVAAGIRVGHTPRHWNEPSRPVDALDSKGDALAVLQALGVPMAALSVTTDAPGYYHPGRSGVLRQGPKTVLAQFGELHPTVAAALDLSGPVVAFEVFLDVVPEPKRRKRGTADLPSFQPVRRDLAFLVDAGVAAETLLRAARGAERQLVTAVSLFDRYAGDKLPEGKVSLALEVTLQPREKSLTDAEIEAAVNKVVAAVTKATGATLRA